VTKRLEETTIDSTVAWSGSFLRVRRDRARLPDGSVHRREYIEHPGAAAMVALGDDGRVLIERQFRYPMGRVYVEFPAGKLDAGEHSLQTAKRELLEETGYVAREWAFLTQIHPAIGFADELLDIYLARGLTLKQRQLDHGELLEIDWVPIGWLVDELKAGRLPDVKTQIATFWLEKLVRGEWAWPVFEAA
jgi:ADP-ribose pyrophosphatase